MNDSDKAHDTALDYMRSQDACIAELTSALQIIRTWAKVMADTVSSAPCSSKQIEKEFRDIVKKADEALK